MLSNIWAEALFLVLCVCCLSSWWNYLCIFKYEIYDITSSLALFAFTFYFRFIHTSKLEEAALVAWVIQAPSTWIFYSFLFLARMYAKWIFFTQFFYNAHTYTCVFYIPMYKFQSAEEHKKWRIKFSSLAVCRNRLNRCCIISKREKLQKRFFLFSSPSVCHPRISTQLNKKLFPLFYTYISK